MPDDLVLIYTASGQVSASIIQSLLEAHGIPVMTTQESLGALYSLSAGALGEVQLFVPARYQATARDLIQAQEP